MERGKRATRRGYNSCVMPAVRYIHTFVHTYIHIHCIHTSMYMHVYTLCTHIHTHTLYTCYVDTYIRTLIHVCEKNPNSQCEFTLQTRYVL